MRKILPYKREKKEPSVGVIQWRRKNDGNPNALTDEELHQRRTQRCEEESRTATRRLHKHVYRIRGTYQENKDALNKGCHRSYLPDRDQAMKRKNLYIVDSGASMHMMSKSDLTHEEKETCRKSKRTENGSLQRMDQSLRQKKLLPTSEIGTCSQFSSWKTHHLYSR